MLSNQRSTTLSSRTAAKLWDTSRPGANDMETPVINQRPMQRPGGGTVLRLCFVVFAFYQHQAQISTVATSIFSRAVHLTGEMSSVQQSGDLSLDIFERCLESSSWWKFSSKRKSSSRGFGVRRFSETRHHSHQCKMRRLLSHRLFRRTEIGADVTIVAIRISALTRCTATMNVRKIRQK